MKAVAVLLLLVHCVLGQFEGDGPTCRVCPDAGEREWPPAGFVLDEGALRCSFRCGSEADSDEVKILQFKVKK